MKSGIDLKLFLWGEGVPYLKPRGRHFRYVTRKFVLGKLYAAKRANGLGASEAQARPKRGPSEAQAKP